MDNLDQLFNDITELRDKWKDIGDFNLLHSIGFSSQETMHSKFIANLLDPKGKHGQKDHFLKLFIKHSQLDFNIENIKIRTEMSAKTRRMDITIANSKSIIIIENKIWAKDQNSQLEDYYNYCEVRYINVDLVYLTPYGTTPSDCSLGETLRTKDIKLNLISYEKVIIPWIEECIMESNGRLKVSLEMYKEILYKLINRDRYMNEIFNYLKDKEKLKLAIDINSALLGRKFITEQTIEFFKQCLCDVVEDVDSYTEPIGNSFYLTLTDSSELEGWQIVFEENLVYAEKNQNPQYHIKLFNPKDINEKPLQYLILEDKMLADEWVYTIFEEMKSKN